MQVDHQIIKSPESAMATIIGGCPADGPATTEPVIIHTLDDSQNKREISHQLINKLFDNIIL
jgi:hypothetical protein